jgi:hypothetical protein
MTGQVEALKGKSTHEISMHLWEDVVCRFFSPVAEFVG